MLTDDGQRVLARLSSLHPDELAGLGDDLSPPIREAPAADNAADATPAHDDTTDRDTPDRETPDHGITGHETAENAEAAENAEPEGGDPACWLDRVCPECGLFVEGPDTGTCPRCGTALTDR